MYLSKPEDQGVKLLGGIVIESLKDLPHSSTPELLLDTKHRSCRKPYGRQWGQMSVHLRAGAS
jgi:hypothetical protein